MGRSCLWLLLCGLSLLAQTNTGELRLTVKDPSGAVLGAQAELVNSAARSRLAVTVAPDGKYTFKNLAPGVYRLTVIGSGFQPYAELIAIRPELPVQRNIVLSLQPQQATVNVEDSDTLLDPDQTNSAQTIGSQQIGERAAGLPGRGLIDLITTQPGWTLEANGILHPRESEYDVQYVVNGFPLQENRSPAFLQPAEAENVTSMTMYAAGIPAEFGNKLGGVVELNTTRNTSAGFHGVATISGGSFGTASGYLSGQWVRGKTTSTVSGESFLTDRFLDPPTEENFQNHASSATFHAMVEHDFSDANRLSVSAGHAQTGFLVPNDLLQQALGQRQDRRSNESEGRVWFQHVFSPSLIGVLRGSVRDVSADLWSNPLSAPIAAEQHRGFREEYLNGSLSGHWKQHDWKTGAEFRYASLREQFGYQITSYQLNGEDVFDSGVPSTFRFQQRHPDREQAGYAQDTWHIRNLTISAGLRFDHYSLLVNTARWSPRLSASWLCRRTGTILHGSYDRTFGTPPFENLLVSAAPQTRFQSGFYLPLRPSRGNYYEGGVTQALGHRLRLDANYFLREVDNFEDDDLLLNTGVSFPISFQHARVRGTEVKLDVPTWGRFSGFASYANTIGIARYPITGGLFLDSNASDLLGAHDTFPISQDQRNVAHARIRYQIHSRFWTAWSASYNSGLPVEGNDFPSMDLLLAQYGTAVVRRVNFDRMRVRPDFSIDGSVGAEVWRHEKHSLTLQADGFNLSNRLNLINFAGLLSGTAIAQPRSFSLRLRAEF